MMLVRTPIDVKEYAAGLIPTYPLSEIAPTFIPSHEQRTYYLWDRKTAYQVFGKPDGIFKGEFDYGVYGFTAIFKSNKTQRFILLAHPAKSGKGSCIELISEEKPESVLSVRIAECLARNHPSNKGKGFKQTLVWSEGELL